ncbi:MAG: Flp pilus assembly complex ATPase component TadA [Lentisphaerae bacterium]|nr:Flp pilus assembly complex ATPase component TadA [Lentisphaerota bacterium]
MSATRYTRLETILHGTGLFSEEQIRSILSSEGAENTSITSKIAEQGYASEEEFLVAVAKVMKLEYSGLKEIAVDTEVITSLPAKVVFQYNVIPIALENGSITVASNDPFNMALVDALRVVTGKKIKIMLSSSSEIAKAVNRFYGVGADTVERMMADSSADMADADAIGKMDLTELDQEASIVKFVNQVIWQAFKDRATDIHFEPMEDELRIRYRIDGVLHQTSMPPQLKRFQAAIISRIKVMSNMDIAEKRLPQDGRIGLNVRGDELDIRVSTMPTVYGESISLRLLTKGTGLIQIESIGLGKQDQEAITRLIHRPHGIILSTGPTGSGKSTSLYAFLHIINSVERRIITIEEPIEYEMPGINQIDVKSDIGLTFALGLRHILRQDPDVIMVGEIRDFETAEIAIRASLTGHLVFSTLHTNDASGAVTRLLDMGVEPFLVSSSLTAVLAQRLVRRLCPTCKALGDYTEEFLNTIGFPEDPEARSGIKKTAGCDACRNTGFSGRTGLFELLLVTEHIRPLIIARESASAIKQMAVQHGTKTLISDGWEKVAQGKTTIEEVLRVAAEEE